MSPPPVHHRATPGHLLPAVASAVVRDGLIRPSLQLDSSLCLSLLQCSRPGRSSVRPPSAPRPQLQPGGFLEAWRRPGCLPLHSTAGPSSSLHRPQLQVLGCHPHLSSTAPSSCVSPPPPPTTPPPLVLPSPSLSHTLRSEKEEAPTLA
jgi:hypothetical protein